MRDMRSGRDLRDNDWSPKEPGYPKREDRQFKAGGGVRKMQLGGPLTPGYAGRKSFYPFNKGPEEEVKSGAMRSESTENARALDRAGKRMDTRVPGSPTQQEIKDTAEDARTFKQTGDYKRGGGVKKADGGMIDPMNPNDPSNAPAGSGTLLPGLKLRPRGPVDPSRRDPEGYLRPDVDPLDDGPISRPIRNPQPGFKKGGKV
jgi:hypothetical protein